MRPKAPILTALLATATYLKFIRPWVLNWGATGAEASAELPGDRVLDAVAIQTTRAIGIDAPASEVWPWLVQMGPRPRAGVYTYDWLERRLGIDIENADRILPEFQSLDEGTFWPLSSKGQGLRVLEVIPEKAIVLQWEPARSTWAFVLEELDDGTTRLISRNRIPGGGIAFWLGMVALMEAGSLVMEREMLRGIKRRVESLAAGIEPPILLSEHRAG